MPGMTPFGIRVSAGQAPPIDPATLGPQIYLSGLTGITPSANLANLTSWQDQSGNARHFANVPAGDVAPVVLTGGFGGLLPGVSCISISNDGGAGSRVIRNNTLPGFGLTAGTTQYLLANLNGNAGVSLVRLTFWPQGANGGPDLIYQGTGFNGGGGFEWTSGTVVPGHAALQIGSLGIDTGIVTPNLHWDLWGLVITPQGGLSIYLNGALLTVVNTSGTAYSLATEMDLGGPSLGAATYAEVASYLLYTAAHTPRQVQGIYRWYVQHYGL